jgi:ABC-type branched-subunit amino acid transport system substrate-binding protein
MPVRRITAIVAALSLALTGCDSGDSPGNGASSPPPDRGVPSNSDALVVGLVGTMTGSDSWRGEDAYEGADLAIHDLNEGRGSDRRPFRLQTLDDRGDPEAAASMVRDLAGLDRTVGIIYAGPPEALPDAEAALASRGIPAILLYGDLYGAQRLTAHTFQMGPSLLWEARRLASYVSDDRGYRKAGALLEFSEEGGTAQTALQSALRDRGLARAKVVRYDADEEDLRGALEQLKQARTEAIVFHGSPTGLTRMTSTLAEMGASYRTTAGARIGSARRRVRRRRIENGHWRPQVLAFSGVFSPRLERRPRPGTIVSATLGRGVYYLPVPGFQEFRQGFQGWWDSVPTGWQFRAYDAARMIGWAAARAAPNEDIARELETIRSERFSATQITLGRDDHTAVDQTAVGLWVIPHDDAQVRERDRIPDDLPWVPLARGFALDGESTDIQPDLWRYLFRDPPPEGAPPPPFWKMKFGVKTGFRDPVH